MNTSPAGASVLDGRLINTDRIKLLPGETLAQKYVIDRQESAALLRQVLSIIRWGEESRQLALPF